MKIIILIVGPPVHEYTPPDSENPDIAGTSICLN